MISAQLQEGNLAPLAFFFVKLTCPKTNQCVNIYFILPVAFFSICTIYLVRASSNSSSGVFPGSCFGKKALAMQNRYTVKRINSRGNIILDEPYSLLLL
jgi:hypothetical protein